VVNVPTGVAGAYRQEGVSKGAGRGLGLGGIAPAIVAVSGSF